jgi:hypothetical protein
VHTVSIISDDPGFTISDSSTPEGNSGTKVMTFFVHAEPAPLVPVSVQFATQPAGATALDFNAASGTVQFAPGEVVKPIDVTILGDTQVEGDDQFFVNLSNPIGGSIVDGQAVGTIQNDDSPSFSLTDAAITEGDSGTKGLTFTVVLSQSWTSTVSVDWATAPGTATPGSDYISGSGTLTFAPGLVSQPVTVTILGDTVVEPNEAFFVNLSNPIGATIQDAQGVGTILADDGNRLTINDRMTKEGNSGTTPVILTVTLTPAVTTPVTVDYATADGTGVAGSDYQSAVGSLTFAAGETTKTITVLVNGDTTQESFERFYVNLSNVGGDAVIADSQGQVTISNEDGQTDRSRLMFHNFTTNRLYRWHMKNGNELDSFNWVTPWATDPGWTVGAVADFDQDGQMDYLWHNVNDGRLLFWYIDGDNLKGYQFLPYTMGPPWRVATTFDSDGSGRPDIVYYNTPTGVVHVVQQDNATVLGQYDLTNIVSAPWSVVASADIVKSPDVDDELLLYNSSTGQILWWNVTGPTRTSGAFYPDAQSTSVAYTLVSAKTDFNNDGLPDILWHNPTPTGVFSVWFMNGTTKLGTGVFVPYTATDPVWRVVGAANIW